MIPPAVLAALKGKESASGAASALKNDLYVRKWTTVTGKGKAKKLVDHEVHVNPVGVALGAAGVVIAGGLAALAGALTLRASGKTLKMGDSESTGRFMIDTFDAVFGTKTVVDKEAWTETVYENDVWVEGHWLTGSPTGWLCNTDGATLSLADWNEHWFATHKYHDVVPTYEQLWVDGYWTTKVSTIAHPAVTHEETDYSNVINPGLSVLMTKRGIPTAMFEDGDTVASCIRQAVKRKPGFKDGSVVCLRFNSVRVTHPKTRKQVYAQRGYYEYKKAGFGFEDKEDDSWIKIGPFGLG